VDEEIHAARFLRRHVRRNFEALHLAGDLAGEARRVEAGDAGNARRSGERVIPGLLDRVSDGAYDAEAGDDDSAAGDSLAQDFAWALM
jgi:hypothetical protein